MPGLVSPVRTFSMKGFTVSAWIWITGSVVIGMIALTLAYNAILWVATDAEVKQDIRQLSAMMASFSSVCTGGPGNRETLDMMFGRSVQAYYASESRANPPDKIWQLIMNKSTSSGSWLCMKLKSEDFPRCVEIGCNVEMPYLGATAEENFFTQVNAILGKGTSYKYGMDAENRDNNVMVSAAREA